MKTSLDFEGPADFSVGQIRISNGKGFNEEWIATPGQRRLTRDTLEAGYYIAEISPAGVRPQSVIFEVHRGVANTVHIPDFAALSANGSGMNFLDVRDRKSAIEAISRSEPNEGTKENVKNEPFTATIFQAPLERGIPDPDRDFDLSSDTRLLSIGLAMERSGIRESWDSFNGVCKAQLSNGRLSLEIDPPEGWSPELGQRLRLSVAIQGLRVERLLLPLYRGGTSVSINPSPISSNDVTLEITPRDPNLRAIWRALEAGTREHAEAVRDHVLRIKGPEPIAALEVADPWEAMLAGLIFLRFPEVFGELSPRWTHELCERHGWAADVFIIRARQIASAAGDTPEKVRHSAMEAIALLSAAHSRGSPYFSQTNLFFNELVESLSSFEDLSDDAKKRIARIRRRQQRELPLQRSTSVSFSWLSRDQRLLKEKGILAPRRQVSGRLRRRDTSVVFKGRVQSGQIMFESPTRSAPKKSVDSEELLLKSVFAPTNIDMGSSTPPDCPALTRPSGPPDDPNNGRFGGRAESGGFRLTALFPQDNRQSIAVALLVEADEHVRLDLGDSAWFCLHPTFSPEWVKVFFRGRRASLTVQVWGGFTVGVWIPAQHVELERDLSEIQNAPQIIRER